VNKVSGIVSSLPRCDYLLPVAAVTVPDGERIVALLLGDSGHWVHLTHDQARALGESLLRVAHGAPST
jgi:hypothetical protein